MQIMVMADDGTALIVEADENAVHGVPVKTSQKENWAAIQVGDGPNEMRIVMLWPKGITIRQLADCLHSVPSRDDLCLFDMFTREEFEWECVLQSDLGTSGEQEWRDFTDWCWHDQKTHWHEQVGKWIAARAAKGEG